MGAFMMYALVVSVTITAAAIAAARTLRLWRYQARFVWGAAMAISIAVPLGHRLSTPVHRRARVGPRARRFTSTARAAP